MTDAILAGDRHTVTVRVPISIRRRGGRKLVLAPNSSEVAAPLTTPQINNAVVKAIARAFRWRDILEMGEYATISEIAAAEKINSSYVSRVLRLTLLAPKILEAILDGRAVAGVSLDKMMRLIHAEWDRQVF